MGGVLMCAECDTLTELPATFGQVDRTDVQMVGYNNVMAHSNVAKMTEQMISANLTFSDKKESKNNKQTTT